jgi:hypothetical protein
MTMRSSTSDILIDQIFEEAQDLNLTKEQEGRLRSLIENAFDDFEVYVGANMLDDEEEREFVCGEILKRKAAKYGTSSDEVEQPPLYTIEDYIKAQDLPWEDEENGEE